MIWNTLSVHFCWVYQAGVALVRKRCSTLPRWQTHSPCFVINDIYPSLAFLLATQHTATHPEYQVLFSGPNKRVSLHVCLRISAEWRRPLKGAFVPLMSYSQKDCWLHTVCIDVECKCIYVCVSVCLNRTVHCNQSEWPPNWSCYGQASRKRHTLMHADTPQLYKCVSYSPTWKLTLRWPLREMDRHRPLWLCFLGRISIS